MDGEVIKAAYKLTPRVIGLTSALSFLTGAGLSGMLAMRHFKKVYEARSAQEIAEAREYYKVMHKKEEFSTPEKAAAALLVETTVTEIPDVPDEVVKVIQSYNGEVPVENVFSAPPVPPAALLDRDTTKPYVITQAEWGETDYTPIQLTYYAGDNTLADEDDQPLLEVEDTIGEALGHFGDSDPEQPNVVLVRNERLVADFEITKSNGTYAAEVAGLDPPVQHLQHSAERMPRRRRPRDE